MKARRWVFILASATASPGLGTDARQGHASAPRRPVRLSWTQRARYYDNAVSSASLRQKHRYRTSMHDSGVVASIVADDSGGLAEAYDTNADPLYQYCLRLLGDPAGAADAVQDTFVIAAARPAWPREPGRARAWLYAVARNECLRNPRARNAASPPEQAPDVTDAGAAGENADGGDAADGDAARAGLLGLFDDAAEGLRAAEREAIELQLRQGLAPAEVAVVLGVSRGHAHALLSRAREQLEVCLGDLLTGRAGQGDCAELASMLDGWDGRLTVVLRKRLHGHIERCATCGARRVFELRPAMLRGLSPGVAMAAAAADSLRAAAGPPAALRAHTLALAAGQDPGAIAHRAAVLRRAGASGRHGFPKPVSGTGGGAPGWRGATAGRGKRQAGAAAAAAVVLARRINAQVRMRAALSNSRAKAQADDRWRPDRACRVFACRVTTRT